MTVKELRKFLDECSASDRDDSVFDNLPVHVVAEGKGIGDIGLRLTGFRIRGEKDNRQLHIHWLPYGYEKEIKPVIAELAAREIKERESRK